MRRVDRGDCPAHLDGPGSKGGRERRDAIAYYSAVPAPTEAYDFRRYKLPSVVRQLVEEYAEKCAYCESIIAHVGPSDIEHFRPKGAYRNATGAKVKPGYFWLAAEWPNLFPSCASCNRPSKQSIVGEREPRSVGKENHFPLKDESRRATRPGQEVNEEPLLLNPNQHDVERHLEFRDGGVVVPGIVGSTPSAQGRVTIDVLGLQRDSLVRHRADRLHMLKAAVKRYRDELPHLQRDPADPDTRYRITNALNEIGEYLCHRKEYLTMTRQYIERTCPELIPLPGCGPMRCLGAGVETGAGATT